MANRMKRPSSCNESSNKRFQLSNWSYKYLYRLHGMSPYVLRTLPTHH